MINPIRSFLFLLLLPGFAFAESPLQSTLEQYAVEKNKDGKEFFRPAAEEEPGSTIEYRLTLSHVGECKQKDSSTCALQGLVPTLPVPTGTEYIADSAVAAETAELQVSIDHGATWETEPVIRIVTDEKGNEKEIVIGASEYTNLRWMVAEPVLPEHIRNYSYRVQVK